MKQLLLLISILLGAYTLSFAQAPTVLYDYNSNHFNGNQPLPEETEFVITGSVGEEITQVDITLLRPHKEKTLYKSSWQRPINSNTNMFEVAMTYKLRSGNKYDYRIDYYRLLSQAEQEYLKIRLFQSLDTYIRSSMEVKRSGIKLLKPVRQMMSDLNDMASKALNEYLPRNGVEFEGFSGVVESALKSIEDTDLKKGKFVFGGNKKESKALYADQTIADVQKVVRNEAEQYFNGELTTLYETKMVDNYMTNRRQGAVSINVGYGGVFFDASVKDNEFSTESDGGMFVGFSFPFGRKAYSSFLANTSISAGIFTHDLEDDLGREYTGPFIKRPFYVGLGYKVFRFVRLNAGATFLEQKNSSNNTIKIRPFIGVSAELNLSIGIGDK